MGCTTGAKIFKDEEILVVFKNKDFKVKNYIDKLALDHSHAFGVRGQNLQIQKVAGFSIGVNQYGLVVVNSNILATPDSPYDLITERVVLEAKNADEAIAICEQEIQTTDYQWCNMIVATPQQLVAIELTSSEMVTEVSNDYLVRTNHHLILKTDEAIIEADPDKERKNIEHSEIRFKKTHQFLKIASDVEDIVPFLRSHHNVGICRHGRSSFQDLSYTTVYSYLITIDFKKNLKIVLNVAKGPPCRSRYIKFNLEFPLISAKKRQIKQYYPI